MPQPRASARLQLQLRRTPVSQSLNPCSTPVPLLAGLKLCRTPVLHQVSPAKTVPHPRAPPSQTG